MKLALLAVSCAWFASCSSSGTARVHPEWPARFTAVRAVVLAPPEVIVLTPDSEEAEQELLDADEMRDLKAEMMSIAAEALRNGGLGAELVPADDPRAKPLHEAYERALQDLYRPRYGFEFPEGEEGTYRVSLGPAAAGVAQGLEGEAVLCIRVVGVKRPFGAWLGETVEAAFEQAAVDTLVGAVIPGPQGPSTLTGSPVLRGCFTKVSLVDRRTGELLWTDLEGSEGLSKSTAKSQVRRLVRRLARER